MSINFGYTCSTKPKEPSEPVTCDICDREFDNRKYCRNHVKRLHPDELEEWHIRNTPKMETQTEEYVYVEMHCETYLNVIFLNYRIIVEELSMDDSTLPLDMQNKSLDEDITMTQCESDTTAQDNQDAVVNSSSPTLFLITIPGYSTVRVTQ